MSLKPLSRSFFRAADQYSALKKLYLLKFLQNSSLRGFKSAMYHLNNRLITQTGTQTLYDSNFVYSK